MYPSYAIVHRTPIIEGLPLPSENRRAGTSTRRSRTSEIRGFTGTSWSWGTILSSGQIHRDSLPLVDRGTRISRCSTEGAERGEVDDTAKTAQNRETANVGGDLLDMCSALCGTGYPARETRHFLFSVN